MERENLKGRIDWITTLIPFVIVLAMMLVFMLIPTQSKLFVDTLRGFFGEAETAGKKSGQPQYDQDRSGQTQCIHGISPKSGAVGQRRSSDPGFPACARPL